MMIESEAKFGWQKNKGRSMGLKKRNFVYGSLHSQFGEPATSRKLQRPPSPEDVEAPPMDSDDEAIQQPLIEDENLDGLDLDTPPKLQDSRRRKARVPRLGNTDCISPGRAIKESIFNFCEPSDIRPSSFGNGGRRRSVRHQKQESPETEKKEESAIQDPNDMGLEFGSSQKRVKTTYSTNIHGSAPLYPGKRSPKKPPSKVMTRLPNGFTEPDMNLIHELEHEIKTKDVPTFMAPPSMPDITPTYRMRRSPRKLRIESFPPIMMPSFLPSPEKPGERQALALNSLPSKDGKSPSKSSFTEHMPGQPGNDDLHGSEDLRKLVQDTKKKFKRPLEAQAPEPISSIATSSIQSLMTDLSDSESSLSSAAAQSELDASEEHFAFINSDIPGYIPPLVARCPVCKEVVDQEFLDKFISGKRFRTLAQNRFHTAHRTQAAKANWQAKGYPEIEWKSIDKRMSQFHDTLEAFIKGQKTSFYRNSLEDRIKAGKHRTLTDVMTTSGIEGLSPGYYGSRGARVMVENIMSRFQSKIRRLAASDKVVAAAGVSGYVQTVLVPELAVLLIMDDLGIDAENARGIMAESVDIGDLLNEEEEDEITKELLDDELSDDELRVAI